MISRAHGERMAAAVNFHQWSIGNRPIEEALIADCSVGRPLVIGGPKLGLVFA